MDSETNANVDSEEKNPIPEPVLTEAEKARIQAMLATGFEDK